MKCILIAVTLTHFYLPAIDIAHSDPTSLYKSHIVTLLFFLRSIEFDQEHLCNLEFRTNQ